MTKEESFEAAIIKTNEDLADPDKTLDILINGAGIVGEQRWEKLYDINIVSNKVSKVSTRILLFY